MLSPISGISAMQMVIDKWFDMEKNYIFVAAFAI